MRLLQATLELVAVRDDVEVAAIIDTAVRPPPPLRLARALLASSLRGAYNRTTTAEPAEQPLLRTCASLARKWRVPLLAPRESGVNDRRFVEQIRELRPDATIALMVAQIFSRPLLEACVLPINYHNGLLPDYQGIAATGWSIYERAPSSGFSFHEMTEEVDRGPVLLQASVPIRAGQAAASLERAKTERACSELAALLDILHAPAGRAVAQVRAGSSFSRADLRAIRDVHGPEQLSLAELELRIRAFETITMTLAGESLSITALRPLGVRPRNRRFAFATADGACVEPSRVMHLPPALYRSLKPVYSAG